MSMRLEMLQVMRLAPRLLGESSDLVRDFLRAQQNEDGGFKDRTGQSDLYYLVFALDAWLALRPVSTDPPSRREGAAPDPVIDAAIPFVTRFEAGAGLDFVHLCCLARCWAALRAESPNGSPNPHSAIPSGGSDPRAAELLSRIESHRSGDGGYHLIPGSLHGTAYASFLALGAYQDLRLLPPNSLGIAQSLKFLETGDGAWANERSIPSGSTNATAAAATLLRNLHLPIHPQVGDWLVNCLHAQGGFLAAPAAPIPDLLSTATALHALAGLERDLQPISELCLDFIDTLWTNEGGFHGHWSDDAVDAEYTFYGLLALGHLSVYA